VKRFLNPRHDVKHVMERAMAIYIYIITRFIYMNSTSLTHDSIIDSCAILYVSPESKQRMSENERNLGGCVDLVAGRRTGVLEPKVLVDKKVTTSNWICLCDSLPSKTGPLLPN
jgi:hypothetical protein